MNMEKLNQWLTLIANIGVVAGILFLAIEIRTSTETNRIAIQQNYSGNWLQINTQMANNSDLATLVDKAFRGEPLSAIEQRQFGAWVFEYITQSRMMLDLYDADLINEVQLADAFWAIRSHAQNDAFRQVIENGIIPTEYDRLKGLILDQDGLEKLD